MLEINVKQQLGQLSLEIDVTLPEKGVTAIFGRSGAGKSSLINLIAGLSTPQSGRIYFNQHCLFDSTQRINQPAEKRKIGYVFQEPRLFPHYSVKRNLTYGNKQPDPVLFLQITQLLGIEHLLQRYPSSLSGGEKQRVAIGRALLSNPDILLMDEPLSALDLPRKKELLDYLDDLSKNVNIPILYVSHSLEEIIRLADYLLLLDNGKMIAFDTPQAIWSSSFFAEWQPEGQKSSLLELTLCDEKPEYKMQAFAIGSQKIWITAQSRYQLGDKVRLNLLSKDISLTTVATDKSSICNILQGTILNWEKHTDNVDVALSIDEHLIWATINLWSFDKLSLQKGQSIYLQIKSISL